MNKYLMRYEIIKLIRDFYFHIPYRRKKLLIFALFLATLTGFFELINIASLLPVLKSFASLEDINNLKIYKFLFQIFNLNNDISKRICIALVFIFLVFISNAIKILTLYVNSRISAIIGSDLCSKVFQNAIYQKYDYHLSKDTNDIITNIVTGTQNTVSVVNTVLRFFYSIITFFFVIIALLLINAQIAIFSLITFSLIYILIMLYFKNILKYKSTKIYGINVKIVKIIQESFGNIKDIILDNSHNFFVKEYRKIDLIKRNQEAEIDLLGRIPFNIIEALALISIVSIGVFLSLYENNAYILAILGTLGLGIQRLLRSFQEIYAGWVFIQGRIKILTNFLFYLNLNPYNYLNKSNKEKLNLKNSIKLKSVSFKYKNKFVINDLDLKINKGEIIGIKGKTGKGKSTLINIIMGLLVPTKGQVLIDNIDINKNENKDTKLKYFNSISHVSQDIYLSNLSFAENIAFGTPYEEIDFVKLEKVAKLACIYDFIIATQNGFKTTIGERGIDLSGGQKQRIGIARAFYKGAKILILDEATSSLDYQTEDTVIKNINSIKKYLTIIMIAHRLSTLEKCDKIIDLK